MEKSDYDLLYYAPTVGVWYQRRQINGVIRSRQIMESHSLYDVVVNGEKREFSSIAWCRLCRLERIEKIFRLQMISEMLFEYAFSRNLTSSSVR